ncbi:glycosyltransferase [Clostridium tarantellae]|uniref:Glycosyltransferase n=1 Tax=Clostridium tarantellae TaxID=39493 RepID=A0A6I1MHS1_9CLOT|nr:glycosyltransferase [Clostridium tarantellae]MPQ42293.1 glycosyltransferase [Clostridium tarantellae]
MSKIKVLQISHGLAPGGIESFLLNIYENIEKDNIEISFAVAANGKQYHEDRILKNGDKVYHTSDLNGANNILKHFFRLIKLLKKEGPFDVVHSHIDFFNGVNILAAFIAGVPVRISHSHNTNSANANTTKIKMPILLYRNFMRTLINKFSTVTLGCSTEANDYMYGNNHNAKVICNGINFNEFMESKRCPININLDKTKINFITIGRLCEQKNSIFIVKILNELIKIRKDIHLYWVGKGPQENEVKNIIKGLKLERHITLLGARNDISEILSISDFMIFPSKWEGLPVTLVEAQVAQVPCFISDVISNEANLGLCTKISLKSDAKIWAIKINDYIENNTFNNKIDKKKLNNFNIKNVTKQMKNIYLCK